MEGVFLSFHLLFSRRSCTYDTLGRVTRSESGSEWVQYAYAEDRLIRVVEQDGSGAVTHEYAWTYNSNDKVTSLTETVNGESFSSTYSGKEYRRIRG